MSDKGFFYYHPNHLSSTMYVTNAQQSVVQSFLYAPYGDIISEYNPGFNGNVLPNYAFNAKELDEETGMYYYEARYYAPPTFISRDPLMSEKPWLTPYHYCSNNPVGKVDPSGMSDDWYLNAEGNPIYDKNVNENTQLGEGERYVGKTANWFGQTEQDEQYLYHGDKSGNITISDMTYTVFGNRKTEIYTIPIDALFGFADGVTENNENITITEKGNIHYRNKNTGRIYHGNQYESAKYLKNTSVGKSLKTISHLGFAMNAAELGLGIYNDGGKIGENTSGAIGSITGGWLGFKAGALIGGSIGGCFGGFGAVPGAIIGGVIGSVGGSWGGEKAGKKIYNNLK